MKKFLWFIGKSHVVLFASMSGQKWTVGQIFLSGNGNRL